MLVLNLSRQPPMPSLMRKSSHLPGTPSKTARSSFVTEKSPPSAPVGHPAGAQVIDAKGLRVYPGIFDSITQMGLREIGAVSATVDSTENGELQPGRNCGHGRVSSSEHIPVTRAAGITEVPAVPGSGGLIPAVRAT